MYRSVPAASFIRPHDNKANIRSKVTVACPNRPSSASVTDGTAWMRGIEGYRSIGRGELEAGKGGVFDGYGVVGALFKQLIQYSTNLPFRSLLEATHSEPFCASPTAQVCIVSYPHTRACNGPSSLHCW